jgi:hypothetical protein
MTISPKWWQRRFARHGLQLSMLVVGTLLFSLLLTQLRPQTVDSFDVGTTPLPAEIQASLYPPETNSDRTFQHTKASAALPLTEQGRPQQVELVFDSHGLQPITFRMGPYTVIDTTPRTGFRRYHLLIPPPQRGQPQKLTLTSPGLKESGGTGRKLGVALDWMSVGPLRAHVLDVAQLVRLLLLALALYAGVKLASRRTRTIILASSGLEAGFLIVLQLASNSLFNLAASVFLVCSLGIVLVLLVLRVGQATPSPTEAPGWQAARWPRFATLAELLGWLLLATISTYPLIFNLSTSATDNMDGFLTAWILAWDHHQLWRAPLQLFDANILYPFPATLAYSEHMLGVYPLAAPLFMLGLSPITVQNLIIILNLALCGFGASLLVREITGSRAGGIAAGLIFAFYPYRIFETGHLQMAFALWLPLCFWALERFRREGHWRYATLWGLFALLQSLISYYQAVFLAILLFVYGGYFLLTDPAFRQPRRLVKLAVVGGLILLVHLPLIQPYLYLRNNLGFQRELDEASLYAAVLSDYALPAQNEGPYRQLAGLLELAAPAPSSFFDRTVDAWLATPATPSGRLFPGVLPLILAIVGTLVYRRRRIVGCMLLLLALCIVLSFGPDFRLCATPGEVCAPLVEQMPFAALGLASFVRVPARFALAGILPLSVLSGLGVASLAGRLRNVSPRSALPLSLSLLGLIAWELSGTQLTLHRVPQDPPGFQAWLAEQPDGVLLHLPRAGSAEVGEYRVETRYTLLSTANFRPMVNGYSGFGGMPALHDLLPAPRLVPNRTELRLLQGLGLRFIIVHQELFDVKQQRAWPDAATELRTFPGLREVAAFDQTLVFELSPDPWVDELARQIGPQATLYVGQGGAVGPYASALVALRFHRQVIGGQTWLGYRQLPPLAPGTQADVGLFGVDEDVTATGYREQDVIWLNELLKLVRRPQ